MNTSDNNGINPEPKKGSQPEETKDWENPKNPEATEDPRDVEQLQRQIEEQKRRQENLTTDENENNQ